MEMKWIPVTEKLPESDGISLITEKLESAKQSSNGTKLYETKRYRRKVIKAEYYNKEWHVDYIDYVKLYDVPHTVTAWMPLPRPYYDGDD